MYLKNRVKIVFFGLIALLVLLQIAAAPDIHPQNNPQSNPTDGGTEIKNWWLHNYTVIFSPYSCHAGKAGCYANPDYHTESWLLSQSSFMIEKSWANPALTFWTKHYSRRMVTFCYVQVQAEGKTQWNILKGIGGTKDWYKMTIDLKPFSGEKIKIKFLCEPNKGLDERFPSYYNKQILYIQDVMIVPDSTAP